MTYLLLVLGGFGWTALVRKVLPPPIANEDRGGCFGLLMGISLALSGIMGFMMSCAGLFMSRGIAWSGQPPP